MTTTCKYKRTKGYALVTCNRVATKDGFCTRHHPNYNSPAAKAAFERLESLKPFLVRVTRSTDGEYADVEVRAVDSTEAKTLAVKEAEDFEDIYFGTTPKPTFYVDPMDDDPEIYDGT